MKTEILQVKKFSIPADGIEPVRFLKDDFCDAGLNWVDCVFLLSGISRKKIEKPLARNQTGSNLSP